MLCNLKKKWASRDQCVLFVLFSALSQTGSVISAVCWRSRLEIFESYNDRRLYFNINFRWSKALVASEYLNYFIKEDDRRKRHCQFSGIKAQTLHSVNAVAVFLLADESNEVDLMCTECENMFLHSTDQSGIHADGERCVIGDIFHNCGRHNNGRAGIFLCATLYVSTMQRHCTESDYFSGFGLPDAGMRTRAEVKLGISCDVWEAAAAVKCGVFCERLLLSCKGEVKKQRRFSSK